MIGEEFIRADPRENAIFDKNLKEGERAVVRKTDENCKRTLTEYILFSEMYR